jgi:hypothetical protein
LKMGCAGKAEEKLSGKLGMIKSQL